MKGHHMRHRLLAGLTAGVLLLAPACGGDDGDEKDGRGADESKAVAALASAMTPSGAGPAVSAQYACTAEKLVDDLGVKKLQEIGWLTDDFVATPTTKVERPVAETIGDASVACFDIRKQTEDMAPHYPKATAEDWDAYVACVAKLEKHLRTSVVEANAVDGRLSIQQKLARKVNRCALALGKRG
jgi:hypothetical protein